MNENDTDELDSLVDRVIEQLKACTQLKTTVKAWNKVNGIIPGTGVSISVGFDSEQYEEYTQSMDQCTAKLNVYVALDHRSLPASCRKKGEDALEYGERMIRCVARTVRSCLIDAPNFGLPGSSFPPRIEYVSADEYADLHAAVISLDVELFVERKKPGDYPTIATIDMKMEIKEGL